ncbi:MAG: N-carbamoylputrescine amidase [Alphaproteobacteria bacterium]|nr:N-carbamoylputrescine amidase [Alphaproteobacteria bacterium]
MTKTTVAAIQTSYSTDMKANIDKTIHFIQEAVKKGAQVVLPSELFQNIYFCTTQDERWFEHAYAAYEHPCVTALQPIAREHGIVIPVSIFEREGPHTYNSVVVLGVDGEPMGIYRKSHIPDGPGYQEKYYFKPGNTGFKVWKTPFGTIGVGICWDQWFPEAARSMALMGAEILFYPTAIGSEPQDETLNTSAPWQRAMQGHAVSNYMPVVAANRIGTETGLGAPQTFYGHSFIADERGNLVQSLGAQEEGVLVHSFDLDVIRNGRSAWGLFRDRRSDLYNL